MMLPTVLPLLRRFERLTAERADRRVLVGLLIGGYLLVWVAFGFAAHVLDTALHLIARQSTWLEVNGWVLGAIVLATAGAFQFTRLKYRCLDQCRTPFSFIAQYWRGRRPRRNAFVLGAHHGAFCVGCCWAIMLLMFVVGTGNVGWMLALGAIMAVEKNMGAIGSAVRSASCWRPGAPWLLPPTPVRTFSGQHSFQRNSSAGFAMK